MSRSRHFAVIAAPTAGHVNPLAALAAALRARGHRVTVVHLPAVRRAYAGHDIAFQAIDGPDDADRFGRFMARVARPTGLIGLPAMVRATAAMSDALLAGAPAVLARIGADAVIADAAEAAGPLIARHLGLPFVTSFTGLPLLREPDVPPPFLGWPYQPDARGRQRNASGYWIADRLMAPITRVLRRYEARWGLPRGAGDGFSPLLQVAQCPAALDFPRAMLPAVFHYGAPWRLPEAPLAHPGGDDRPLVFCSLGSLQGSRRRLFAAMAQACAAIGARAVVAHGGGLTAEEERQLPGDPLVRAFWPQTAILPHCAAAILHGGFNSVLDALVVGVPIVALPIAFEQPATAARLARAGAGKVLAPARLRADALAAALAEVVGQPSYRAAADRIGREMRGVDGAAQAAERISAAIERAATASG